MIYIIILLLAGDFILLLYLRGIDFSLCVPEYRFLVSVLLIFFYNIVAENWVHWSGVDLNVSGVLENSKGNGDTTIQI